MNVCPQMIEALAKLASATLWPLVAIFLAVLFKGEVSSIVRRIKSGKVFGNEFVLGEELDRLAETVETATKEIPNPPSTITADGAEESRFKAIEKDEEKVISLASENPELGIILLARKIEEEMRRLLAISGHLGGQHSISYHDMAEYLGKNAAVSENLRKSIELFWGIRNKIVHGHRDIRQEELIRTIDIGLTVLSAIRALPYSKSVVVHPGAELYADPEGRQPLEGVKALILEVISPGGASKTINVFPTTKTDYRTGVTVSWEWNMNKVWGECYYRDPETKEIKKAWHSAAEFIGRDIETV